MLTIAYASSLCACIGIIGSDNDGLNSPDKPPALTLDELPPTPLRRLTRAEYNNTIRDLLGDTSNPANAFSEDEIAGGFEANTNAPMAQLDFDRVAAAAGEVASRAIADNYDAVVGCNADEQGCADAFIDRFGAKAFRRPLTDEERETFASLYTDAKATWSGTVAIQLIIEGMLLSPQFIYLEEHGVPKNASDKIAALTAYELASRLSYFLWQSMPDEALFEAASSGKLNTLEGIAEEASRMLADPKAADSIRSFYRQWMQITHVPDGTKDAALFPAWTPSLGAAMLEESMRFADHVVRESTGTLTELLTASYTFANNELAPIYGATAPSAAFVKVDLNGNQRSGLLSHASLMAATADGETPSVVFRGKFIREQVFCQEMPAPPPNVDQDASSEERLADPLCTSCHTLMDLVGNGFENFDAIGQYVTQKPNGDPIDTLGEIHAAPEGIPETFESVAPLALAMAANPEVRKCAAEYWYRYALRRNIDQSEEGVVQGIEEGFVTHDNISDLMLQIATSEPFRAIGLAQE